MKMKILIFGNQLVEKDNLPVKLLPKLKSQFPNIEFIHIDPTENLKKHITNKQLTIIDTIQGINKPQLITITDFAKLQTSKFSPHDFDLAYNLKILKKIGLIEKVQVVGVPMEMPEEEVFGEVCKILSTSSQSSKNA